MKNPQRVFFRKKVLKILQHYWLNRWDDLGLREILSIGYNPKYYCEKEVLDGNYIKLLNSDYIWFKGVFSKGIHLKSGKYYQVPYHYSNKGMGPRELVFPIKILDQLSDLTLLGDWTRYQLCTVKKEADFKLVKPNRKTKERARIFVRSIEFEYPNPILDRWGFQRLTTEKTICLKGTLLNAPNQDVDYLIPMREIFWNTVLNSPT